MELNRQRRRKAFAVIAAVLFAAITLLNLWLHFSDYFHYRYLKIGDRPFFIQYLLICLVPVVFAVIGIVAAFRRRKVLLLISAVLFIGFILSTFLYSLGIFLYVPVFVSSTDRPEHYGKVDTAWNSFDLNGGNFANTGFPEQIPADAENPRYFYWYMNIAAQHYFYTASWELPGESFERELQRLEDYGYPINEQDTLYLLKNENRGWTTQILIDRESGTIAYFAGCGMGLESFPASLAEFYATEYTDELILENAKA